MIIVLTEADKKRLRVFLSDMKRIQERHEARRREADPKHIEENRRGGKAN
jgi:hypothetical protein